MHVDRAKFICAICKTRIGLDARKTAKGVAEWRCPAHLEGTEPARPQRPGKEKSA